MSSISGPGQKLPRASMMRVGTGVAVSVMGVILSAGYQMNSEALRRRS